MSSTIIKAILDKATQGLSEPYLCTTEDDVEYFVKGRRSSRDSQINEWLCGNIAQAIGLPIAPFRLLTVPDYLYEELPPTLKRIGQGVCFGSLSQQNAELLEISAVPHIPDDLKVKIAAFDWLIKNGDRTKGNPNLLYRSSDKSLIVIDHNLAFDKELKGADFIQNHIFAEAFESIFTDCVIQAEISSCLLPALTAYKTACDNLPLDWHWINDERDIPGNYDFRFAEATLARLSNGQLWRLI